MQQSKRLHILFMASWFPSRRRPTDGNFIQRHAEAVAKKHNVTVLHVITDEKLNSGELEWESSIEKNVNIRIGYIGINKSSANKWNAYRKAYREGWNTLDHRPDIIHLNVIFPAGLFALYYSNKYDIPFIITEHWTGYHSENRHKTNHLIWQLHKYIASKASYIVPVSKDLQHSMQVLGIKGSYQVVPNVVDTDLFSIAEQDPNNERFTLLHVSTLKDEHKNISGMLRTLDQLKKEGIAVHLQIVGDGELSPHQQYAEELELNKSDLSFHGTQTPEGISRFMQKANAFVLFSNYENLPVVILEAFATGTPVISTNVGGIEEHFPKNAGILIPKGDESALANAIQKMKVQINEYKAESIRAYALKNFSIETIGASFEKLYFKALNKKT